MGNMGLLEKAKCEFDLSEISCESCGDETKGKPVYFWSDGGHEPRDGTFLCERCSMDTFCQPDWSAFLRLIDERKALPFVEYVLPSDEYMCVIDEENGGEQIGTGPTPSEAFRDWMRKNL